MEITTAKKTSLLDALIPMLFLVGMLSLAVYFFGGDASWGPNQIALTFSSLIAAAICIKNKYTVKEMDKGVVGNINQALGAIIFGFTGFSIKKIDNTK